MNKGQIVVKSFICLIVIGVLFCPSRQRIQSAPSGGIFVVNNKDDVSAPGGSDLTLREAMGAANGDPGHVCGWGSGERTQLQGCTWDGDCISGGCGYGHYDTILFAYFIDEITLWAPLPELTDAGTWIEGLLYGGSRVIMNARFVPGSTFSVFELEGENQTISNMTIINGTTADIKVDWSARGARIAYNYLGTVPGATSCSAPGVYRNSWTGVWVRSSTTAPMDDRAFIYGNVIGCHLKGISVETTNTDQDEVFIGYQPDKTTADGNWIGTSPTGAIIPNTGHGIQIETDTQNYSEVAHNTILNNGGAGIATVGNLAGNGFGVLMRFNKIYFNGGPAIDLGSDGFTPNDPGDGDSGQNNLINYPEVTTSNGSQVWGTTCGGCTVDIYQAIGDPARGGGGIYKGSVVASLGGDWYVDLSTLPEMVGATVKDVSFATYGPVSGSSEMSPRPFMYLPIVRQ